MIFRNLLVTTLLLAAAGSADAQSLPKCDGTYATIRTSSILPGKMTLFEKAVSDQAAWYAAHPDGSTSHIARIYHYDPKTKATTYATDKAMTITTHKSYGSAPTHDAGWDAFVTEFKASSKIKDEQRVCLPKM